MKTISLNDLQYRFWIDDLLRSDNTYNVAYSFKIEGELQIESLKKALYLSMQEYEPFHSTIGQEGMKPYFRVEESFELPFRYKELNGILTDDEISSRIDQQAKIPFHLDAEFPCRFYLLRTSNSFYLLTLFHHIVMDGLTMFDFCERLSSLYNAQLDKKEIIHPPLLLEDFNENEAKDYPEKQKEEDIKYWVHYLKGASLHIPLPKSSPDEPVQDQSYFFSLGKELYMKSRQFCEQQSTTPFRLYTSVWLITLHHFLQTDELILDHTLHLRPAKYKNLLGSFVNNLPIRISMGQIRSFKELLCFIKDNRHEEQKHQRAIYTDIISELRSKKLLSETKELFNLGIDYPIRNHSLTLNLQGCNTSFYRQTLGRMLGDVCLVIDEDEQLSCSIRHKGSIPSSFIILLSEAFRLVLEQVLEDTHILIKDLNFLTNETKQRIIARSEIALHATDIMTDPLSITDMLSEIATLYPEKTALLFNSESLSYEELHKKSEAIAHSLLALGLRGQKIGVALRRGIDMVVAALGILKAGATYVPLDLANPHKRLLYILEDCDIKAVFVNDHSRYDFRDIQSLDVPSAIKDSPIAVKQVVFPLVTEREIAYIIYTSGTTGVPKGIPITHGNLRNLVSNEIGLFKLNKDSIVLQYANICFDASITEIFTTLAAGATLVIADEEQQKDPALLLMLLKQEHISCATIPPALLSVLPHDDLPDLKTMIVGGESTPSETISFWREGRHFINAYGPTENTVDTTTGRMTEDSPSNDIGTPLAGVSCYILDQHMRLLPDHVPGELYIGGMQLTAGYINSPDLNQQLFVQNPFVSKEDKDIGLNTRLYKSGDLVKRLPNGHLLFLGRTDFQVKIRGLRIELGEIENNLAKYPPVEQALVVTRNIQGKEQLVAYIQKAETDKVSTEELKRHLSSLLPSYMIPAYWCVMNSFPLTRTGKIDRNALPTPTLSSSSTGYTQPPQTVAEALLSHIIASILGMEEISIDDDLFDLGITSIQIMQAVFEASAEGIHTSVSKFYQSRTIRNILQNKRSLYCFWGNKYEKKKPLLLIVCGYPYFKPSYIDFISILQDKFSILILESYNEYFLNKEICTLDILLASYVKMLRPILKDKVLFGITGLCLGGEIGLQLAYKLAEAQIASPKVFVIDGFAERNEKHNNGFIEEPGISMEINKERNRISDLLSASFFFNHYEGETHICLASEFTKRLRFANQPEETDPIAIKQAYERFRSNASLWKQLLPHCQIHYINACHWDLLKPEASEEIKKIIEKGL